MLRYLLNLPLNLAKGQWDWLKFAECTFLVTAIIGSFTAAHTGQLLLVSIPLSITLILNFLNRQRSEWCFVNRIRSEIAKLQSHSDGLAQQIQLLHSELAELDAITQVLTEVQQELQALDTSVQRWETSVRNLEETTLKTDDWERLNVRFLLIDERLAKFKEIIAELRQYLESRSEVREWETRMQQVQVSLQESASDRDILHSQVNHLHRQVMKLNRQNREIVKPYLQRLIQDVKSIRKNS